MIYPDFIIETPGGVRHSMGKEEGVVWLPQFPEDKLVGSEWTPFSWPGGYEIHYHTKDGGVLCYQCANENLDLTLGDDPQWQIVGRDINYEDPDCYCDNCNRRIKPEYLEDDE